jgi:hypothetical protein
MGHQRLGSIPTSRRWADVVEEVTGSGSALSGGAATAAHAIPDIADRTLQAAEAGLDQAINDPGLRFTFYLLTQIVLAARESDWRERLRDLGINLDASSSVFEFTAEVQRAVDDHLQTHGGPTDTSEMAQQAAGEAIAELAGPNAVTLFGAGEEELKSAVRALSTKAGFSNLGQRFFASYMTRFLNFYLSRITAGQAGGRLGGSAGLTEFNDALRTHCLQSAKIVHDFCGEWYSKTEFQRGIDLQNTSGFMAVALRKLQAELRRQREGS